MWFLKESDNVTQGLKIPEVGIKGTLSSKTFIRFRKDVCNWLFLRLMIIRAGDEAKLIVCLPSVLVIFWFCDKTLGPKTI